MSLWQKVLSLCDNTVLVFVLAGLGLLFACCGGNGYWQQSQPKVEPSLTVQALEAVDAVAKLPKTGSLELREGCLFWPAAKDRIAFRKLLGTKVKGSENVRAVYVPLLSRAAFARWQAHLAQGNPANSLPYHQCRVVVELSPWALEAQFPAEAAALRDGRPPAPDIEVPQSFYGSVRRLADEDKGFVEGMTKGISGYDASWTLILDREAYRNDREINRIISVCFGVFGLLSLIPLGIWAIRGWRKPKTQKAEKSKGLTIKLNPEQAKPLDGLGNQESAPRNPEYP